MPLAHKFICGNGMHPTNPRPERDGMQNGLPFSKLFCTSKTFVFSIVPFGTNILGGGTSFYPYLKIWAIRIPSLRDGFWNNRHSFSSRKGRGANSPLIHLWELNAQPNQNSRPERDGMKFILTIIPPPYKPIFSIVPSGQHFNGGHHLSHI